MVSAGATLNSRSPHFWRFADGSRSPPTATPSRRTGGAYHGIVHPSMRERGRAMDFIFLAPTPQSEA
eukprot:11042608-Heterocapsa_arctica.AAC.1